MATPGYFLLVEDDPRDVEITLDVLAEGDLAGEVAVLHDGQEALDYLYRRKEFRLRRPEQPALVFLDVKMPKLGGMAVLEALAKDESLRGIAAVILTSSRQEQDMLDAF